MVSEHIERQDKLEGPITDRSKGRSVDIYCTFGYKMDGQVQGNGNKTEKRQGTKRKSRWPKV
jgi:hypothetical protein